MKILHFVIDSADAFERGRQLGQQASTQIAESIDVYKEAFEHWADLDWAEAQRLASRFRRPISEFDPEIMAEMDGIAAGAGVGEDEVLAINVRTEVMFG